MNISKIKSSLILYLHIKYSLHIDVKISTKLFVKETCHNMYTNFFYGHIINIKIKIYNKCVSLLLYFSFYIFILFRTAMFGSVLKSQAGNVARTGKLRNLSIIQDPYY